jgi:arylsulfatase A-like enzyme
MQRRTIVVLLLLAAAVAGGLVPACSGDKTPPTVIIISIDTLRPERLGVYGNTPDVSPRIDALAQQAVVFDQALANSPYTLPSHMSMLTGLDPVAHGVKRDGNVLSSNVTTLAEALRAGGYQCGGFTDGGYVSKHYGFGQGFHVFDSERDTRPEGAVNGFARILPRALTWLDSHADDPLFLFLHTFDVHAPYQDGDPEIHERFRQRPVQDGPRDHELYRLNYMYQAQLLKIAEYGRMAELLNDYDSGVNEADRGVGVIIDWLVEHGRYDDALFIVVSDHGESFADHGLHVGHGIGLTDDEIHIPLVVKLPKAEAAGRRLDSVVDLTDIPPTVLDVAGLAVPEDVQGESLLALVRGAPRRRDFIFGSSPNTESYFLVRDGWKLISPPSILPMDVAVRHLGPMNPPLAGLGPDEGKEYQIGPKDKQVTLHYDEAGDPLGIRDTLLGCARLFDRAADRRELENRAFDADGALTTQASEMAAFTDQVLKQSLALHESLDDGAAPAFGEMHVDRALATLGYLGAGSDEDRDRTKSELPVGLRMQVTHPYIPPDMRPVDEADKVMQMVRLSLRDGRALPEGAAPVLQNLGETLVAWAVANPSHSAQIGWRLNELVALAEQAGLPVNKERWAETWRAWAEKQAARREASDATPAQGGESRPDTQPPR